MLFLYTKNIEYINNKTIKYKITYVITQYAYTNSKGPIKLTVSNGIVKGTWYTIQIKLRFNKNKFNKYALKSKNSPHTLIFLKLYIHINCDNEPNLIIKYIFVCDEEKNY